MVWMFYEWIKFGKPTALGTVTGMVAGLGTMILWCCTELWHSQHHYLLVYR
jgi:ammonia channel protein AmtB